MKQQHTKARLAAAAADLLDAGGQGAVTLRAVAEAVGVSHNAPYRHFKDRNALLAAVAERDFDALTRAFRAAADTSDDAGASLKAAALAFIRYAREHPARYRLLFSDPDLAPAAADAGGSMEAAALGSFQAFSAIIGRCTASGRFRAFDPAALTGLIYATLHGAIDLELGGRARAAKGLGDIEATVDLLLGLLARDDAPAGHGARFHDPSVADLA